MIVKLIILVLLAWLGYRIYQASKKIAASKRTEEKIQNMVRCEQCGIHLPAGEAFEKEGKYYCSREHLPKPE
jgi:uncharacterized protein